MTNLKIINVRDRLAEPRLEGSLEEGAEFCQDGLPLLLDEGEQHTHFRCPEPPSELDGRVSKRQYSGVHLHLCLYTIGHPTVPVRRSSLGVCR